MAYKPFKMKGHELPGPNQRKSPAKHAMDAWGFDHGHKYHRTESEQAEETAIPPNKKSPTKQATISTVADSLTSLKNPAMEKLIAEFEEKSKAIQDSTHKANQQVLENRAEQIQQNVSPKEFNKQIEEFNKKNK